MIVVEGLSEIPGESQNSIRVSRGDSMGTPGGSPALKSPGETGGGCSRGPPFVSLSSDATRTDRTGTSVRSENLSRVPVKLQGTLRKELFFAVHPPHNLERGYVGVSRVYKVQ